MEDSAGLSSVCRHCDGINLESLKSKIGYLHQPTLETLFASSEICKLCKLILNSLKRSVRQQPMLWGTKDVLNLLTFGPVKLFAVSRDVDSQCRKKIRQEGSVESTLVSQHVVLVLGGKPREIKCDETDALLQMYTSQGD